MSISLDLYIRIVYINTGDKTNTKQKGKQTMKNLEFAIEDRNILRDENGNWYIEIPEFDVCERISKDEVVDVCRRNKSKIDWRAISMKYFPMDYNNDFCEF